MLPSLKASRRRRGMSLVESALYMGIVGIVMGAVWAAGAVVHTNLQIGRSVGNLMVVVQNIQTFYSGQSSFKKAAGSDLTEALVKAEIFPSAMIHPQTNRPVTPWSTEIRVYVGENKNSFRVSYEPSLPEEVCRSLVGRVGGRGRSESLVNVTAGGTSYTTADQLNRLTATTVTGSCKTVSFTFKLGG